MGRSQRGFTLLEATVAFAIVAAAGFFVVPVVAAGLRWSGALTERRAAETEIGGLAERIEAEEDAAWAIFTPPFDAYGSPNADGHELDFFFRDAQNRAHFWAYRYDKAGRIQRLLYAKPGDTPVADGAPLTGIQSFFARTYPVTALQDPGAPIYSALYQGAHLQRAEVTFDRALPWIAGGNQITYVRVQAAQFSRELQLSTQTAPSGFTVLLRYTPSPSASPATGSLTAAIVSAQVLGSWEDCPGHAACSNAEWPRYHWVQRIRSRYYSSADGGYTWTQTDSETHNNGGVSLPSGGDLPPPCEAGRAVDYVRLCSPDWTPRAPAGTAGIDL